MRLIIVNHRWWNCLSPVATIKCWHFAFLKTAGTFTFGPVLSMYNTRHIIFTLHVNELISWHNMVISPGLILLLEHHD